MLTLSAIERNPDLGLRRLDNSGLNPEIAWAHVSELPDPSPWLSGDELLLTTGLDLFREPNQAEAFIQRLIERGVSALGLSTGPSLPHKEIPRDLVEAAKSMGFPLLHVPERTPLQAVVRFVSNELNLEETEPLRRALVAQRKLGEAATKRDGLTAVLATLSDGTGISAVVHDQSLRRLALQGKAAAGEFTQHEQQILERMLKSNQWSLAEETPEVTTLVYPIGTGGQTRGVFLATKQGPMTLFDRTLVNLVVSLLSVLLELRHSGQQKRRELRSVVAETLVTGQLTEVEAALKLASVGVECTSMQALVMPVDAGDGFADTLLSQLERHCKAALPFVQNKQLVILLCDPLDRAEGDLRDLVDLAGIGPVGVGMAVEPPRVTLSVTQAVRAQSLARAKGLSISILSASGGYRSILALGDPVERAAFAAAVLAPLDAHDARYGAKLEETLRTYFDHTLNVENSARSLGIHRHTMRTRLDRISRLTNKTLSEPSDLLELWLACETRLLFVGRE